MVKIRLQRFGTKKRPFYRIVVCDVRKKRDGKVLDFVGWYNPISKIESIHVESEKIIDWNKKGAQPTNTVKKLLKKQGIDLLKTV